MTSTINATSGLLQTSTPNSVAVVTQVSGQANSNPQGSCGPRLLGSARGISVGATGDAAVIPIINSSSYSVLYVIVTNAQVSGASGSIATAALGVFTAAAAGGTAVVANATLSGVTGSTVVSQRTIASTAVVAGTPLYVNVGTALANGTCDIFIVGFDLT